MIVLDENIRRQTVLESIASWYPGQVISVTRLRPQSTIKDEAIPTLLRRANEPTFVTINVSDYWNKIESSSDYCIIAIEIPNERIPEVPTLVRAILRLRQFQAKANRMGKVIHWTPTHIEYY